VDTSNIINAVVQFVLVTGVSFVLLCLLASVIRFYELSAPAMIKPHMAVDEPETFQIQVAQRISTAYRAPRPFGLFIIVFSAAERAPSADEAGRAAVVARRLAVVQRAVRRSDVVSPLADGAIGLLLEAARAQLPVVAQRLRALLRAAVGEVGPAGIGGASYPENGQRGQVLLDQARAAVTADGEGWPLAAESGARPAEAGEERPEPAQADWMDGLTGVLRQERVSRVMQKYVASHRRDERPVSLLYLDIDHLNRYNEHYGREAGDAILRRLGELLQRQVREEDLIGRCGDDEFLILLDCAPADAALVGQRLVGVIKKTPVTGAGQVLKVTVSAGVAGYPDHGITASVLEAAAHTALRVAQESGRNICVRYEKNMRLTQPQAAARVDQF